MIQLIRGFKDILPGEVELWQKIERIARELFEDFGFSEIRIPIMERTELFKRSIGEDTDIVENEMYTFPDRKGELVTLRPEATASICRAYIQHKLYSQDPVQKFYMIGPMFRRERPQKGRYRQFYQIGVEAYGMAGPDIDLEIILVTSRIWRALGLEGLTDPYSQKPLHYRAQGEAFFIYSVGENQQDNQGKARDRKHKEYDDIAWHFPPLSEREYVGDPNEV